MHQRNTEESDGCMKSCLQINHRDSIFFHENNFIPSFVQSWKHHFPDKVMLYVKGIYGRKGRKKTTTSFIALQVDPPSAGRTADFFARLCYLSYEFKCSRVFTVLASDVQKQHRDTHRQICPGAPESPSLRKQRADSQQKEALQKKCHVNQMALVL